MKIIRTKDYEEMSRRAANIIAAQMLMKPRCVLGLATGSTPIGVYQQLVEWHLRGDLDFSGVVSVNLDEYKGLAREDGQSYGHFMDEHLFHRVNINRDNTYLPDGMEGDSEKACRDYDRIIEAAGGIDLQLLGLGHNGHIGFNEPGDEFVRKTHCVDLAESTIRANQRFFGSYGEVPKQAYTVGIGAIMQARRILVVVSGQDKARIVREAFSGPVTPGVQASVLQLHPDVTVVADEAALSLTGQMEEPCGNGW